MKQLHSPGMETGRKDSIVFPTTKWTNTVSVILIKLDVGKKTGYNVENTVHQLAGADTSLSWYDMPGPGEWPYMA